MNSIILRATLLSLFSATSMVAMRGTKQPEDNVATLLEKIQKTAVSYTNQEDAKAYLSRLTAGVAQIPSSPSFVALPANEAAFKVAFKKAAAERVKKIMKQSYGAINHPILVKRAANGFLPEGISKSDFDAYMELYRPLPVPPRTGELAKTLSKALTPILQAGIDAGNVNDAAAVWGIAFYTALEDLGTKATKDQKDYLSFDDTKKLFAVEGSEDAALLKKYREQVRPYLPQLKAAMQDITDAGQLYKLESTLEKALTENALYGAWSNLR